MNYSKSKFLIFENRKEHIPRNYSFHIHSNLIERVYSYKYLGIIIDYKGDFGEAKIDLYRRGQRAYFKLRKLLNIDLVKPKLYLDIFDKAVIMVIPVMTYGSEIWGIFNTKLSDIVRTDPQITYTKNQYLKNCTQNFVKYY